MKTNEIGWLKNCYQQTIAFQIIYIYKTGFGIKQTTRVDMQ